MGLGAWGTYQVSLRVEETSSPSLTWFAWGLTLASAVFEMYAGWWNNYLKGLNEVLLSTRIAAMGFLVKFLVSCALLVAGLGLLSVPVATFVSTMLQRMLSRRYVLRRLDSHPRPPRDRAQFRQLLAVLWPNSWRLGLHLFGTLMVGNAMTFLCVKHLGLAVNGQYGLSLQIASICQNMAFTWMSVKLPLIFQMRAKADLPGLRALMRQRTWLCIATYLILAVGAVGLGDIVVHWLDPRKALLPPVWFAVLLGSSFFALLYNQWGTFILAENRVPYLWPTLATNAGSVTLCAVLLQTTPAGAGALVLAPFIVWSAFNYWYWPAYAARTLETTLLRLLFGRAGQEATKR